jgi:Bax protein
MKHICATLLLLCSTETVEQDFIQSIMECAIKWNVMEMEPDRIPINLVLAQSIIESNWGKSRFAKEANNFFGIRAMGGEEYILSKSNKKIKSYETKCDSVNDYMDLLSFGEPYKEFKEELFRQWAVDRVDLYAIIEYLGNYAEDKKYKIKLKKIIKQLERMNYGRH